MSSSRILKTPNEFAKIKAIRANSRQGVSGISLRCWALNVECFFPPPQTPVPLCLSVSVVELKSAKNPTIPFEQTENSLPDWGGWNCGSSRPPFV
jgi:hypothetical protein